MKFLLDSNIIIAAILGTNLILRDHLAQCDEGDLVTSSIVYAEVAHGSRHGKPPPIALLDRFFEEVEIIPFDGAAAGVYATLPFQRGSFDRLIAAHALSLDVAIVTGNVRHFADILGLKVENWTLPLEPAA